MQKQAFQKKYWPTKRQKNLYNKTIKKKLKMYKKISEEQNIITK